MAYLHAIRVRYLFLGGSRPYGGVPIGRIGGMPRGKCGQLLTLDAKSRMENSPITRRLSSVKS